MLAFDETVSGKKNDLSEFGVDFANFVGLELVSKEGVLDVLINGNQVYKMEVPETPFKIKGITLHFEGAGAVQNVELKNSSAVFYSSVSDVL